MKRQLQVNFSGGRTSAYMCHKLLTECSDMFDMRFVFANTGCEHEDTLRFVNEVDKRFGLNLAWAEAVVHPGRRKGSTHKIVTYETASRNGEPFEAVVSKYGLPNKTYKPCTRELKEGAMRSYIRSIGWEKPEIAVGIRADEARRVSPNLAEKFRIIYPLVHLFPTVKEEVLAFFEQFDWDLKIGEYEGNCVTCFQKSDKKLNTLYRESPGAFEFFVKLEDLYSGVGSNNVPGPRKIFRGYRSTRDLINQFQYVNCDTSKMFGEESGGCSESCEIFETVAIEAA